MCRTPKAIAASATRSGSGCRSRAFLSVRTVVNVKRGNLYDAGRMVILTRTLVLLLRAVAKRLIESQFSLVSVLSIY